MSVNKVILLGNVGNDPEISYPEKDMAIARFSLATNERNGNQEITEWHSIVMMGRYAEWAERYIRKGTRLFIEGKLRSRTHADKFEMRRKITEIYVDYFEILGRNQ